MIYKDFKGISLSHLGFGAMRLPVDANGKIDETQVAQMVSYAIAHGVNYFDTAYPYHGGLSETVLCRILNTYPRDSFYLADKYPGHQICSHYDPAAVFEDQLRKCGVDYFDFYLLHNVCESSIDTYMDPQWNIIPYFIEQQRLGRIRHLGFSAHAEPQTLKRFLERYEQAMEFCQIQLNYLDWTLQKAREKCDLLTAHGVPIWVMEPVRGGKLASLEAEDREALRTRRPTATAAEWAFRWLQGIPGVKVILSGMSTLAQMQENIQTFAAPAPLSAEEGKVLESIAVRLGKMIPCTGCRYCCDGCPMGIDIPLMMSTLSDARFQPSFTPGMRIEFLPTDKQPSACIGCGACTRICPQHIDIPSAMKELQEVLRQIPNWTVLSKQREEAAAKLLQ